MKLRKASLSNLLELQSICKKAYAQHFGDHWVDNGLELHLEYQYGTKRLEAELVDKEVDYFFIQQNGLAIGFIKVNYQSSTVLSNLDNSELEKIYILPSFSGKGIGRKAMNQVIKKIRTKRKEMLFLCVIDTNIAAIAFYKKLGFEFHSKTRINAPFFREELKGMDRMVLRL